VHLIAALTVLTCFVRCGNYAAGTRKEQMWRLLVPGLSGNSNLTNETMFQALAASSDPSGKKYCVPLMGADTLRRSSCRS
jgi:hypothetical protein